MRGIYGCHSWGEVYSLFRDSPRRCLTESREAATATKIHLGVSPLHCHSERSRGISNFFGRGIVRDVSTFARDDKVVASTRRRESARYQSHPKPAAATPPAGPQIQSRVQPQEEHPPDPASRYVLCKTE